MTHEALLLLMTGWGRLVNFYSANHVPGVANPRLNYSTKRHNAAVDAFLRAGRAGGAAPCLLSIPTPQPTAYVGTTPAPAPPAPASARSQRPSALLPPAAPLEEAQPSTSR